MTPGMEFEGKTVDHAVDEACSQLHLTKEELKYDVLSYGSSGIFGLVGTKKARIRIKPAEKRPAETVGDKEDGPVHEEPVAEAGIAEAIGYDTVQKDIDDETVARGMDSLKRIIDAITDDATISVEKNAHGILFNVSGGNAGVLIGKRGQTLEAIQYIIEKVVTRQNNRHLRVQVDVEGYLKTRRENLEKLAARLAQKAVRTGKPMTIGQMNAHDRRIVHLSLKGNAAVRTQSLGEGLYRKLMIFPRKKDRDRKGTTPSQ